MARLPTRKTIFDLAGEGQRNRNGTSRQALLRKSSPGDPVILLRDPANRYDPNAILVTNASGAGLGFIARADAARLSPALDAGRVHRAQIHALTGGVADYSSVGCRISIAWDDATLPSCVPLDTAQADYRESRAGCLPVLLIGLGMTGAFILQTFTT